MYVLCLFDERYVWCRYYWVLLGVVCQWLSGCYRGGVIKWYLLHAWFCWMRLLAVVGRCLVGWDHCEVFCSTRKVMLEGGRVSWPWGIEGWIRRVFFGNKPSRIVKCLYKELFMWEWNGGQCSWGERSVIGGNVTVVTAWNCWSETVGVSIEVEEGKGNIWLISG